MSVIHCKRCGKVNGSDGPSVLGAHGIFCSFVCAGFALHAPDGSFALHTSDGDVYALKVQLEEALRAVTLLQARGNQLIEDQRDLKGLVREVLQGLTEPNFVHRQVSGEWVLKAQAMLERMK